MVAMFNGHPIFGPRGPAGPDGNPIGTIISYMGLTAPKDYLVCDGAEYNIADYSELARFFEAQFGTPNHFGGDGTTTFAVPDLRNLFLRGYHGNAAEQLTEEIGEKQEATEHVNLWVTGSASIVMSDSGTHRYPKNLDAKKGNNTLINDWTNMENQNNVDAGGVEDTAYYTSHPINMAVLYCIKVVTSVTAENVYSTEEQVIGRWIDGKPIYRKVYQLTTPSGDINTQNHWIGTLDVDYDHIVNIYGMVMDKWDTGVAFVVANGYQSDGNRCALWVDNNRIGMMVAYKGHQNRPISVVIEYTKTTG